MIELKAEMTIVEKAIAIAVFAHAGQTDKGGLPYIHHALAVGLALDTDEEMCVGILHDVVEDTKVTLSDLRAIFPDRIVAGVDGITKRKKEKYLDYLNRVKANPLSLKAKLRDLAENRRIERIPNPTEKDFKRIAKYNEAEKYLLDLPCRKEVLL